MPCRCWVSTSQKPLFGGSHIERRGPLLGTTSHQLCSSFFHAGVCFEWQNAEVCLMQVPGDSCIRNSVCLLARVQSAQGDILDEVRYTNCFQGHTSINQHAEEFLITDDRLNLQPKAHLTLYVTYQPCHYSGGGRKMRTHPRSCTNRLISWYETKLAPLKITLTIKPCDIYRAHWTDPALFAHPADWLTFGKRTQSALAGVQKLLSFLKAMTPADWTYLLSHSTVDQIPIKAMEKRLFFDDKVQTWLTSIQFRSSFAT